MLPLSFKARGSHGEGCSRRPTGAHGPGFRSRRVTAATAAHSTSAYRAYQRASWAGLTVSGLSSTRNPVELAVLGADPLALDGAIGSLRRYGLVNADDAC
jgi:hypothetical protein